MALRVFAFEDIDERLPLLPLAARRALDVAGRKLSLAAWQQLTSEVRRQLAEAGAGEVVPIEQVCVLADGAEPAAREQPPRDAADWRDLPEPVAVHGVEATAWRKLDELERFALSHLAAKPGRHKLIEPALRELGLAASPEPHESTGSPPDEAHPQLTHLNQAGEARMVSVAQKPITARRAVASARVRMAPATAQLIVDEAGPKGDVLAVARVAGIGAAKRTPELIPLCHGIALTRVAVSFRVEPEAGLVHVEASAEALDRTGVEMEAMVAASVASLTIYDMLKAVQKDIIVERVVLLEKQGGRSGHYRYEGAS